MFMFFFGLIFIVGGGYNIHRYRRLNWTGERVTGTVVGLRRKNTIQGGRAYRPVLAFRTLDGRDIQAVAGIANGHVIAQPGEQVPVIYDPRNPARAEINTRAGRAVWVHIFFTMAGVALICCGLFWWISKNA